MAEDVNRMSAAPPPGGAAASHSPGGSAEPQRVRVPISGKDSPEPPDGAGAQAQRPSSGAPGTASGPDAFVSGGSSGPDAPGTQDPGGTGQDAAGTGEPRGEQATAGAGREDAVAEAGEAPGDVAAAPQGPSPGAQPVGDADQDAARQRDQYLGLAQRTQADFDNYRKRMARELAAAESRGVRKLAVELLPALDNLGLALAAAEAALTGEAPSQGDEATSAAHPARLVEGIRLVHAELFAALKRAGIEAFSPEGERFDPNEHEAMAQHPPTDGVEAGTITQVYQQGYRVAGTLIRPARVIVAG